jgi:phenylacetate-CoA ligase
MNFNNPVLKLLEKIRGTSIIDLTSVLMKMDRFSRAELDSYSGAKLAKLVKHHVESSQVYRELIKKPFDFAHPDLAKLPILRKDDLRHLYKSVDNAAIKNQRYNIVRSGGTTGVPVQMFMSYASRSWGGAAMYRYYEWWKIRFGNRIAVLWGAQDPAGTTSTKKFWKKVKNRMSNRLILNTFFLDDIILEQHYKAINRFDPNTLRGYANSLYEFALYVRSHQLTIWPSLKVISSTSEKLSDEMKSVIEQVFKVPVTNQYGCGEVNGIAFECPEGRSLHIAEEHAIIEVVDDDGNPLTDTPGRILITDLDNEIMPIIRYEVGDIGVITNAHCKCGRQHKVLREITGRLSEALVLANGRKIAPSYWSVLLRPYEQITQACVRVISERSLQVDMVLQRDVPPEVVQYLRTSVSAAVGQDIQFELRKVDSIPAVKSGKKPWVRRVQDEVGVSLNPVRL